VLRPPNFFLGLLRVVAWIFWRDPVDVADKAKREPRPPRRPTLCYTVGPIPDHIHSIVRTSWFKRGRMVEVDEFQIMESDEGTKAFHYVVGQALRQGADVSVLSTYPAHALGIREH
jgi:hypothetical protein